jgi:hypothetical protein
MFVTAAVLTACALLCSTWVAVATSSMSGRSTAELGRSWAGAAASPPPVHGSTATGGATQPGTAVLAPGQIAGDGIFGVGTELQPGTYRTAGPSPAAFDNCYWERSRDNSGEQRAVIAEGLVSGPVTVTIKRTDGAFKSSGCETWTRVR